MSRKRPYTSPRHSKAKESARSRLRLPVFLLIVSLVLTGAGFLLVKAFAPKTPAATVGVIDLRADMSGLMRKKSVSR